MIDEKAVGHEICMRNQLVQDSLTGLVEGPLQFYANASHKVWKWVPSRLFIIIGSH